MEATPAWLRRGLIGVRSPVVRRQLLILVAGLLVCVYALGVLGYVLAIPDLGLRCAFSTVANRIEPEFLYAPKGTRASDLRGSTVLAIGDQKIETWPQVPRAAVALRQQRDQAKTVTTLDEASSTHVLLDGMELVRVRLQPPGDRAPRSVWCRVGYPPLDVLLPFVLWFFLKAGLFIVGAMVYWKRPEDNSAARFFWLSIVTAGAYLGGYHWSRIITQPTLILVFMVCAVLVPAVSLHFYLVFPRPKAFFQRQTRGTLVAIYGPPALFLLVLISNYLRIRWWFRDSTTDLDRLLEEIKNEIYVYFGVAALWYLASIGCLVHSFRTARDMTERNQVKWILFGALASLVPIGYSLYLALWQPEDFGGGAATWPMFAASVCVTAAFTVSITRYRLMQLDQIVSSGVVYFLFSSLAGLVYYAVVFLGTLVFSQWTPASWAQALGVSSAALVVMLVLDWLRGRLKRALDRRFYREKHQLERTLRRLSQTVEQLIDPPAVARRLLQASAELLGVARGAVYLREGSPPLFRLADSVGPAPPLTELSSGCPLVEALQAGGTVVARPRLGQAPDPAERQLQFVGGAVAQALVHEGQLLALLVLGPRDPGTYTAEDLNLLAAFAQLTALALENAEGHRTIEALNRDLRAKVEKISEQQRRILALQSQLMSRGPRVEDRGSKIDENAAGDPRPTIHDARSTNSCGIVGSGPVVRDLLQQVRKVAVSPSAVLLRGESGTGKELLAQALHEHSPRQGKPFVKVHCAALSPGLLESELFGHVKGAFTGAHRDKVGRFELAHGGTLFLDEIGDVSWDVQTKLLRVLEEMTFERVGSSEPVRVDVRVIAATHQDLERLIREGRFREDLYYRLNVLPIRVPPLRDRAEDIPELTLHFLRVYAERCSKAVAQVDDDVLAALKAFFWPGNVRQLENVIERAVVIADGPVLTRNELPPELAQAADAGWPPAAPGPGNGGGKSAEGPLGVRAERAERDRRERERLVRALAAAGGSKAQAARALGLPRSTLVSRLRKHGLQ
jgi:transcriptional regulator with GAF, ATPase, and Fis domain